MNIKLEKDGREYENKAFIRQFFDLPDEATVNSVALRFLSDVARMMRGTGGHLEICHQDGSTVRVEFKESK